MIKKLLRKKSGSITGAAIVLALASLLSRLLGVLRDRALAHTFGAGEMLDAYFTAFRVPDLVYNLLIAGALTAGFIPLFSELYHKNKEQAWEFTNRTLTLIGIAVLALSLVLLAAATPLTKLIAPGFTPEQQLLTARLTRILFLSPLILGLSAIISGVLQSMRYFLVYALSPILYNIGIIIGALFFTKFWGIDGVAYGVILGALLHLLIQLPTVLRAGWRPRLLFGITKQMKLLIKMMIPRTLSLATYQIVLLVFTVIATTLSAGSVTVFNFANNIHFFAIGLVGISFALAAFPTLSQTAESDTFAFVGILSSTIRKILFLIVPITGLFLLLRAEVVRIILGSGSFDWISTVRTADSLAFFAIGLFAQTLLPLFSRGFWALKDSKTPFIASLCGAGISIFAAYNLVPYFEQTSSVAGNGVLALAAAYALGGIGNLIILWLLLRFRIGSLREGKIITSLLKMSVAAIFLSIATQVTKNFVGDLVDMQTFIGVFIKLTTAAVAGLAAYGIAALLLKSPEMTNLINSVKKRLVRFTNVQEVETQEHL